MKTNAKLSEYRCCDREVDNKRKMVVMLSRVTLILHFVSVPSSVVEYLSLSLSSVIEAANENCEMRFVARYKTYGTELLLSSVTLDRLTIVT